MEKKHYFVEASLYYGNSRNRGRTLAFRRFSEAAEAIRFAVEELSPSILNGCTLEIGEDEYFGRAIRLLYDHSSFPLLRCKRATRGVKGKQVDAGLKSPKRNETCQAS